MKTVKEVAELTGVSIRTLQYYDKIGLLHAAEYTEAGYRLYDDAALEKLQQILLFRELEFPLKDIKAIIESPDFNADKALRQQIELLTLKKNQLESLIDLACEIKNTGVNKMNFKAFDKSKSEQYAARAKAEWGNTPEYRECEKKSSGRTEREEQRLSENMMKIFSEFGEMKELPVNAENVKAQVKKLQDFITKNYYKCTDEILLGLGNMYACDGEFKQSIDNVGGTGTAQFVSEAVNNYFRK